MKSNTTIPSAQAVGGVARSDRDWLYRTSIAIPGRVRIDDTTACVCCRATIEPDRSSGYCRACVWHQRYFLIGRLMLTGAVIALGREAPDLVFRAQPFLGSIAHAAAVLFICALPAVLAAVLLNVWRADPVHGHWGKAMCRRGSDHLEQTVFHNLDVGRSIAALAHVDAHELREPRTDWSNLLVLGVLLPALFCALAWRQFPERFFTLHVDNSSGRPVTIEAAGGELIGTASASQASALAVPRATMTLIARSPDGQEIERIQVGGLQDILAAKYESVFPDIEYDVNDNAIWNLEQAQCYRAKTHVYGSFAMGGDDGYVHRSRAFAIDTSEPFKQAPAAIRTQFGIGARSATHS